MAANLPAPTSPSLEVRVTALLASRPGEVPDSSDRRLLSDGDEFATQRRILSFEPTKPVTQCRELLLVGRLDSADVMPKCGFDGCRMPAHRGRSGGVGIGGGSDLGAEGRVPRQVGAGDVRCGGHGADGDGLTPTNQASQGAFGGDLLGRSFPAAGTVRQTVFLT